MACRAFITVGFGKCCFTHTEKINCDNFVPRTCSYDIERWGNIFVKFTTDIDTDYSDDEGDATIILYFYKEGEPVRTIAKDCYEFEKTEQLFDVRDYYRVEVEFLPNKGGGRYT